MPRTLPDLPPFTPRRGPHRRRKPVQHAEHHARAHRRDPRLVRPLHRHPRPRRRGQGRPCRSLGVQLGRHARHRWLGPPDGRGRRAVAARLRGRVRYRSPLPLRDRRARHRVQPRRHDAHHEPPGGARPLERRGLRRDRRRARRVLRRPGRVDRRRRRVQLPRQRRARPASRVHARGRGWRSLGRHLSRLVHRLGRAVRDERDLLGRLQPEPRRGGARGRGRVG